MYLCPLNILYTCDASQSEHLVTEADLDKKVKSVKEKKQIPKLQVFYKDGHYFTLNNAELRVCRKLQNDGICPRIKVERVPEYRIPKGILDMMVIPKPDVTFTLGLNQKRSKRGYNQLAQTQKITDESKSDPKEDNDSISSYSVSSDEEQDDDKDLDTDEWVSSTDESTESEVEEEEESFL